MQPSWVDNLKASLWRTISPEFAASTLGFGVYSKLSSQLVNSSFNALARELDYASNAAGRGSLPPMEELLKQYYAGYLDIRELAEQSGFHGIDIGERPLWSNTRNRLWNNVLAVNTPHFPPDLLRKWTRQGVDGANDQLMRALTRQGFHRGQDIERFVDDYENLNPGQIITLWLYQLIGADEAKRLLKIIGFRSEEADSILLTATSRPSVEAALQWQVRGQGDEQASRDAMIAAGFTDAATQDRMLSLRFSPPSPQGLVAAAGSGAYDEQLAALWGLDGDRFGEFNEWAKRTGIEFSAGLSPYGSTNTGERTWTDILWRSHWQIPSIATLAEIVHRFRGNPDDPSTWSVPDVRPLSADDIQRTLRASGLPSQMREYAARMIYAPIPVRQLRLIAKYNGVSLGYIASVFMDNGFSPNNANQMARAMVADLDAKANIDVDALRKRTINEVIATVKSEYQTGAIGRAQAIQLLTGLGIPDDIINTILNVIDGKVAAGIIGKVVSRARSDVFNGRTNIQAAYQRLLNAGMDVVRAQQTTAAWQAEFGEGRKYFATDKVLRLLRKGFIGQPEALQRLTYLGWANADQLLLLAEVQSEILSDQAAALRSQEHSTARQERDAERLLRKAAGQASAVQRRLKTLTPPKDIVKWYAEGLWSEPKARQRLILLGYPTDVIDTMFLEALEKHGKGGKAGSSGKAKSGAVGGK